MTRLTLRSVLTLAFVVLTPLGCGDKEPNGDDSVATDDSTATDDTGEPAGDADADGFTAEAGDCDDNNAAVNPGAAETPYNGVDDDCDSTSPDDDLDGDGYTKGADCNDGDETVSPGATEVCDGADNDCDGLVDPEGSSGGGTFYVDSDGDGFGDDATTTEACTAPEGYVEAAGDCDDGDASFNPGAVEDDCADPTDYNCDGSTGFADADGDGFAACEECDDTNKSVNPIAKETCDSLDNNCDGDVDEGVTSTFYEDGDGDGYGDRKSSSEACSAPSGYVSDATDCDDSNRAVNPKATEVCDTKDTDEDCDGLVDDDDSSVTGTTTFYADSDGDGYGATSSSSSSTKKACDQPASYSTTSDDCDDTDSKINPGATEVTDREDNDCDGDIDEVSYTYTHDVDIQPIWNTSCKGCHTGGGSSGKLKLDSGYSAMVNVKSTQATSYDMVEPGDTSKSYLWAKLQGTHASYGGSGSTMPKGTTMSASDLAKIETWITEGAPN
jgi:hypothetical protein